RLAPLRERKEDIPSLLNHFLGRYGRNHSMTQEVLEAMLSYDWPGNVRELENCVQHMVAVNSGPLLHLADLPSPLQNHIFLKRAERRAAAVAGAISAQPMPFVSPTPVPSAVSACTELEEEDPFLAPAKPMGTAESASRVNGDVPAGSPIRPLSEMERKA